MFSPMFRHCLLDDRKNIRPIKVRATVPPSSKVLSWTEWKNKTNGDSVNEGPNESGMAHRKMSVTSEYESLISQSIISNIAVIICCRNAPMVIELEKLHPER